MSAKKNFYLAVKEQILKCTKVKHSLLFNNQFDEMDGEDTFPFPCAFIEFTQLEYTTKAEGLQEADTIIRIHVGFESLATEELAILDLLDDIHLALQSFSKEDFFTPLNRIFEGQDTNHDNVRVWLMDYSTLIIDTSGHRMNRLVKAKVDDLCVVADAESPRLQGE